MEFIIDKNIFLMALTKVQGIIDKKSPKEILNNVLLRTAEEGIELIATDIEISFYGIFDANIIEEGAITIPGRKIFEIIKELPDAEVYVKTIENDWVEIKCHNSQFKIGGISADEFPVLPDLGDINYIKVNAKDLKEMIDGVSFSIAEEGNTYGVPGILIEFIETEPPKIRFITTDGHRLSYIEKDFEGKILIGSPPIISRKGGNEVKKLCDILTDNIEIGFNSNIAIFKNKKNMFMMTLLNRNFPDYRKVIPESFNLSLKVNRDGILQTLKRMLPISDIITNKVFLKIEDQKIFVEAQQEEGEGKDEIEVEMEGEGILLAINIKYLIEIINNIKDDVIAIKLVESEKPVVLMGANREDCKYIIMPMRIKQD